MQQGTSNSGTDVISNESQITTQNAGSSSVPAPEVFLDSTSIPVISWNSFLLSDHVSTHLFLYLLISDSLIFCSNFCSYRVGNLISRICSIPVFITSTRITVLSVYHKVWLFWIHKLILLVPRNSRFVENLKMKHRILDREPVTR